MPRGPLRGGDGCDGGSIGSNSGGSGDNSGSGSSGSSGGSETVHAGRPRAGGRPATSPAVLAPSASIADCWRSTASSTGGRPKGRSR